jgi:hypothetical protein
LSPLFPVFAPLAAQDDATNGVKQSSGCLPNSVRKASVVGAKDTVRALDNGPVEELILSASREQLGHRIVKRSSLDPATTFGAMETTKKTRTLDPTPNVPVAFVV